MMILKKRFSMSILKLFLLTSLLLAFNSYAVPVDFNVLVESANKPVANADVKLLQAIPNQQSKVIAKGRSSSEGNISFTACCTNVGLWRHCRLKHRSADRL